MDTLSELEAKMAFMENTLEKLDEVVVEQAKTIASLEKEIGFLKEKIESLEDRGDRPEDKPPPHY